MNFKEFDNDYKTMIVHPSFYRYFFPRKWDLFWMGFEAIQDAIYFRFDYNDNIDRLDFFAALSRGWYRMYDDEDENILELWGDK